MVFDTFPYTFTQYEPYHLDDVADWLNKRLESKLFISI